MSNIYVTNPIKVKLFSFKSDNSLFIKKLFIFIGIVPKNVQQELIKLGNYIENIEYTKIDFNKITAIETVTSSPLVLHGGSGIPSNIRKKLARNCNIAKFNIGTELRMLFGNTVRKNLLRNKTSYDRIELLKPTIKEMKRLTKKIISNIGPAT